MSFKLAHKVVSNTGTREWLEDVPSGGRVYLMQATGVPFVFFVHRQVASKSRWNISVAGTGLSIGGMAGYKSKKEAMACFERVVQDRIAPNLARCASAIRAAEVTYKELLEGGFTRENPRITGSA